MVRFLTFKLWPMYLGSVNESKSPYDYKFTAV